MLLLNLLVIWSLTLSTVSAAHLALWSQRNCYGIGSGCKGLEEDSCCKCPPKVYGSLAIQDSPFEGLYVKIFNDGACGNFRSHRGSANPPKLLCHPLTQGATTGSMKWYRYDHVPQNVSLSNLPNRAEPRSDNCQRADMFIYTDDKGVRNYIHVPEGEEQMEKLWALGEKKDWLSLGAYEKLKIEV